MNKIDEMSIDDQFLHYCQYGELENLAELLEKSDVDVNVQDKDGCTGLHLAIGNLCREIVDLLLNMNPDFSICDNTGYSAFHWAIFSGERHFLNLVCPHVESIDMPTIAGAFPIHLCVTHREKRSLDWLLEKGADPNSLDADGYTALHISALDGLVEHAQMLITGGADLGIRNKDGETATDVALRLESFEVLSLLESLLAPEAYDSKQ